MTAFEQGEILFVPDHGFTEVRFQHLYEGFQPLNRKGASWLVARLAYLTEADPLLFGMEIEVEESGLFIADLLAEVSSGKVLAKLQLQASPEEVVLLGIANNEARFQQASEALKEALGEDGPLQDMLVYVAKSKRAAPRAYGRDNGVLR